MWLPGVFVLPLIAAAIAIKVPVDRSEEVSEDEGPDKEDPTQNTPTYYVSDDANVDSYLIPPDPHKPEDVLPDVIVTPATYLLPPSPGTHPDYYYKPSSEEPDDQSDWYPIAQAVPTSQLILSPDNLSQSDYIPVDDNPRRSKSHKDAMIPIPAIGLEPPHVDARNDYFAPTSAGVIQLEELQGPINGQKLIPLEELQRPLNVPNLQRFELPIAIPKKEAHHLNYRRKPVESTLALHLIPPQPIKYKIPTKLYPKKFGGEFKPKPLPIAQYADESALEIPRAKPAKLFKPLPSSEVDYLTPTDEKINYLYRKAENKRKLKGEELSQDAPPPTVSSEETYSKYKRPISSEQEASESNYRHPGREPTESTHRHPGRNTYPAPVAPVRQTASATQQDIASAPAPDERTEFRMHGMKGPHSYQFGFDTGKGKNRQFRFEERDNDGQVRGHYGYMDKHGKLRVVNYSADPKHGFHAEAPVDKE